MIKHNRGEGGWQRQDFPWHDALKCCALPPNNAIYAVNLKKKGCEKLVYKTLPWCILTSRMEKKSQNCVPFALWA